MVRIKSNKLKNQHKSNIKTSKVNRQNSNTKFNISKKKKRLIKFTNNSNIKGGMNTGHDSARAQAEDRHRRLALTGRRHSVELAQNQFLNEMDSNVEVGWQDLIKLATTSDNFQSYVHENFTETNIVSLVIDRKGEQLPDGSFLLEGKINIPHHGEYVPSDLIANGFEEPFTTIMRKSDGLYIYDIPEDDFTDDVSYWYNYGTGDNPIWTKNDRGNKKAWEDEKRKLNYESDTKIREDFQSANEDIDERHKVSMNYIVLNKAYTDAQHSRDIADLDKTLRDGAGYQTEGESSGQAFGQGNEAWGYDHRWQDRMTPKEKHDDMLKAAINKSLKSDQRPDMMDMFDNMSKKASLGEASGSSSRRWSRRKAQEEQEKADIMAAMKASLK